MKLNKRICLLTPLFVLCCILLAGAYVNENVPVIADDNDPVVGNYRIYEYSERNGKEYDLYESTTMEEFLKENDSEYEIRTLDAYLFDYNGNAWNEYWYGQTGLTNYFAFVNGNCEKSLYTEEGTINQGSTHTLGIVADDLKDNYPVFNQYTGNAGIDAGKTLFDPAYSVVDNFKTAYDTKFQFIYDPATQMYKYNSGTNHAQLTLSEENGNGSISKGTVVQYADTVSPENKFISQMEVFNLDNNTNDYYNYQLLRGATGNISGTKHATVIWTPSGAGLNLHFNQFYTPSYNSYHYEWSDTIQSDHVEYLYFDISISVAAKNGNRTPYNTANTIKVIINDDNDLTETISYQYIGGDTGDNRIQLKIPMKEICSTNTPIETITLQPINAGSTLFPNSTSEETINFNIYDFGISYLKCNDLDQKTNTYLDCMEMYVNSNFLPFVDIAKTKLGRDFNNGTNYDANGWKDYDSWLNNFNNNKTLPANRAMNATYGKGVSPENPYSIGEDDTYGSAAHFGMAMETEFYLPKGGQINDNDVTFTFNGDDDLWIFVDGKLVLDVGGCHGQVKGVINFATGQVTYYNSAYDSVVVPNYTDAKVPSNQRSYNMNKKDGYESIISSGTHKLQIFYLERAAGASNLTLEFNLPIIPKGSVYVSKDVEYDVAEKDLNPNNNVSPDETLELEANGATTGEFQKDDFSGRLYDFQVMYTTEATVPSWEMGASGVITSSVEYVLYETENPNNKTDKLYTSSDGRLSIPAGYTAVISVPEAHDNETVEHIYVSELGGTLSNKAYENLPGNYTYNDTEVQYKANVDAEFTTQVPSVNLSTANEAAYSTSYKSPMYFNFINNYTWIIDFGTQSDTEISDGDKSATLDIDEDVKVTFENELGEENWLDGEGSVENIFGKTEDNQIYNP